MRSLRVVNKLSIKAIKDRVYALEASSPSAFIAVNDKRDEIAVKEEWLDYLEALDTGNDIIEISITKSFLC